MIDDVVAGACALLVMLALHAILFWTGVKSLRFILPGFGL
jgi:hypothetical protein